MSYARVVDTRTWSDAKFTALSMAAPNAQSLWLYLLTGPETTQLPGVLRMGKAHLAEALNWPVEDLLRCFSELECAGMAMADWKARLVWLPRALAYQSLNASWVGSWTQEWDGVPECQLKGQIWKAWNGYLKNLAASNPKHQPTLAAFRSAVPEPSYNECLAVPPPSPPPWGVPGGGQDLDLDLASDLDPPPRPVEKQEEGQKTAEVGDALWAHVTDIKRHHDRPAEIRRPKGFNAWARGAVAAKGWENLKWAVIWFHEDPAFERAGWSSSVFMSDAVYPQRCHPPKPRPGVGYG